MDAIDVIEKIQGYLTEQAKTCANESKNLSNMTEEQMLMHIGKAKAFMVIQEFISSMVTEMMAELEQ